MPTNIDRKSCLKAIAGVVILFVILCASMVVFSTSCTKRLDGELRPNQKPVVFFVNIPLEGERFSINPTVHWYGSDVDGLIDYYIYHVWIVPDSIHEPMDYIMSAPDSLWDTLWIDQTSDDPQTTQTISMVANLDDPVNSFVEQIVFLRAYDLEGLGSDIVYRAFNRNDHPPETALRKASDYLDTPFVDAEQQEGSVTGVRMRWGISDILDYSDAELQNVRMESEWRLYGPYDDSTLEQLMMNFDTVVFVSRDGRLYDIGDTVYRCSTIITPDSIYEICFGCLVEMLQREDWTSPGVPEISGAFQTCLTDTIRDRDFGELELMLRVRDDDFLSSEYNVVVESSLAIDSLGNILGTWIADTAASIYNVYRNYDSDTTVRMNYVFWVRCRDDAYVPDLVPDYLSFPVINPQNERDVLLLDFHDGGGGFRAETGPRRSPASIDPDGITNPKRFWTDLLTDWADWRDTTIIFDTTDIDGLAYIAPDYMIPRRAVPLNYLPMSALLKHKMIILYHDYLEGHTAFGPGVEYVEKLDKAINSGVNCWLTMRNARVAPSLGAFPDFSLSFGGSMYQRMFGVSGTVYEGWMYWANLFDMVNPRYRIEDFVGTYALNDPAHQLDWGPRFGKDTLPNLSIDTAMLHHFYLWLDPGAFVFSGWQGDSGIYGLPGVQWSMRSFGTKPMYRYRAREGKWSPTGEQRYEFEGAPVAHRLDGGHFRTVHMNFTLPAFVPMPDDTSPEADARRSAVNDLSRKVLDWLYEPWE